MSRPGWRLAQPTGDACVTACTAERVTRSKSLTLPHRQRSGKRVTTRHHVGYPQARVTRYLKGVVARAHVRARKDINQETPNMRHPGGRR